MRFVNLTVTPPPPRPVVGMPLAREFNECVAMDLQQYSNGIWLLHLIDCATRFSASSVIRSKVSEVVMKHIFRTWVSIFGPPGKFLSDNGGEFSNEQFRDMCGAYNIIIKTTAAESPWSNELCERHNAILADAVTKTVEDTGCELEVALSWALHAKNALPNVHGFSSYQLVFGRNPVLPCLSNDKPPALEEIPADRQLSANILAVHSARAAFIQSECSEKIRRALRHNVRASQNVRFLSGDQVYYTRSDSPRWRGPASVLGQDG